MRDNVYYIVFKENPNYHSYLINNKWVYLQTDGVRFAESFKTAYKFHNLDIAIMFAKDCDGYIIAYDY